MKAFFALYFLFLVTFVSHIVAQEYVFVKDSISGEPVSNTVIKSDFIYCYTDSEGKFDLLIFAPSDTLFISHISYKSKKVLCADIKPLKIIYLNPAEYETDEVVIRADSKDANILLESRKLIVNEEMRNQNYSIGDLLKNHTSLHVRDYGGHGGLKTVSSRGLSSENTLVLFNEARINDLRTGSFDFSSLGTQSVDFIEVYKSSEIENPRPAPGGVVKLYSGNLSEENSANLGVRVGSNNLKSLFARYKTFFSGISGALNFERSYSTNNYKYGFEDKEFNRNNAFFSKTFISGDFQWRLNKWIFKVYSHFSALNNGIPGFVVTNNNASSSASTKTNSFLSIANIENKFSEALTYRSTLTYQNQKHSLTDPLGQLFIAPSRQIADLRDMGIFQSLSLRKDRWLLNIGHEFSLSGIIGESLLSAEDEGRINFSKTSNKIYTSGRIDFPINNYGLKSIMVTGAGGYEYISEKIPDPVSAHGFSYSAGIGFKPQADNEMIFKINISESFRNPSFNERYYSSVFGNPDLNKEKYYTFSISLETEYQFSGHGKLEFSYYNIKGSNKIVWIPSRLALQVPYNFAEIRTGGYEFLWTHQFFSGLISTEMIYNYTDSRNRGVNSSNDNSYNKFLIYTPLHQLNFSIRLDVTPVLISLQSAYVSERFYTNDNSPRNVLPEYFLLDLTTNYKFNLFGRSHSAAFSLLNVFDTEYFIIQSYPMPLRNYLFTYKLEIL